MGAKRACLLGLGIAGILCAIGIGAVVSVAVTPTLQRPDWRDVGRVVRISNSSHVARAILIQDYPRNGLLQPLRLYAPLSRHMTSPAVVDEFDVVAVRSPSHGVRKISKAAFCWWGATCNLLDSKLRTSVVLPGFRRTGPVIHAQQFSIMRLRAAHPRLLSPGDVWCAFANQRLGSWALIVERPGAQQWHPPQSGVRPSSIGRTPDCLIGG